MTRQKPAADRRTKLVQVRVSEDELAAIDDAAKRAGLDRSAFMRWAAMSESRWNELPPVTPRDNRPHVR